jgi:hypothetical protein
VLFFNLFTCAEGMGNTVNGVLSIPPPTIEEYLFSANNNLLTPLVQAADEEDNFGDEGEHVRLYYTCNLTIYIAVLFKNSFLS